MLLSAGVDLNRGSVSAIMVDGLYKVACFDLGWQHMDSASDLCDRRGTNIPSTTNQWQQSKQQREPCKLPARYNARLILVIMMFIIESIFSSHRSRSEPRVNFLKDEKRRLITPKLEEPPFKEYSGT